jgi:hypothetical protein
MLSFVIHLGDTHLLEFLGLFQCFLELAGSVVLYEFDLLGDVGFLHLDVYDWVDYDLVEFFLLLQGGWKGGGKLVF